MASKFYAVKVGRTPGIYSTWDDCKTQVDGVSGATYKSFKTAAEAAEFLGWGESDRKTGNIKSTEEVCESNTYVDTAYVDGSYNVATGEFSYGVVMFHGEEELHFKKAFDDKGLAEMRNVAGEIKGAEAAMEYAYNNGMKSLCIYHDYEGIAKWPLRQWKANKEGTQAYQAFYDKISKSVDITFIKVKGHSGDKYNDLADKLAKEALGIL